MGAHRYEEDGNFTHQEETTFLGRRSLFLLSRSFQVCQLSAASLSATMQLLDA